MSLTRVEKERISDSRMKIQSIANSLKHVDPKKIERFAEIQDCLDGAEQSFKNALHGESENPRQS
ncbi:MAG: hypothetical protein ABSH50_29475 [Bryobacteraceae bacterium]|jgi:hypothetical protein